MLDVGPMWFVEVLLVYSLGYAAWCRWRRDHRRRIAARAPLSWRTLVALAAGISVATILVRLVLPFDSAQPGQLKLWQWPQFLALFGLGVVAAQRGWLDPVPARTRHICGVAALVAGAAVVALVGAVVAAGLEPDAFELRLRWAPIGLAAVEGPLAVAASVWLLGAAQAHLDRPPGRAGRALARSPRSSCKAWS